MSDTSRAERAWQAFQACPVQTIIEPEHGSCGLTGYRVVAIGTSTEPPDPDTVRAAVEALRRGYDVVVGAATEELARIAVAHVRAGMAR